MRALVIATFLALWAGRAYAQTETDTAAALAKVRASEKRRAKVTAARADTSARYGKELAEIAKLKKQKSSWRRDRQLKAKLKASLATAKTIAKQNAELTAIDVALSKQRKALVAAIDAELGASPAAARAKKLRALRAEMAPKAKKKAKKIVLPDDEVDPLADPDELDQQAAALRASEEELARQIESLDRQAARFKKQAELRKEHARADELASRDDDQPRRTSGSSGGRDNVQSDGAGEPAPPGSGDDDAGGELGDPSFEGEPAIVLADVVDEDTVDALKKAERSDDPATKAAAAEKARAQVARRKAKLEKRRKEIEARAKKLRE